MEPDFEWIFGVLNCFPGVLITGSHCLLDSGVVDPKDDDTCNFKSSRGCQDDRVRACPNWLEWLFSPIFNPYLIPWLTGMKPIAQEWVSFLRFLRQYGGRLFPGPEGVGTSQFS